MTTEPQDNTSPLKTILLLLMLTVIGAGLTAIHDQAQTARTSPSPLPGIQPTAVVTLTPTPLPAGASAKAGTATPKPTLTPTPVPARQPHAVRGSGEFEGGD